MNWDNLRVFLTVAEETSIKRAANSLGLNRSTVQRRIAALEKELDARLIERLPDGYHTTPAGDEVLRQVTKIEEATNEISMRVAGQNQCLGGSIRVAVSAPLAAYVLMPEFAAFNKQFPNIKLEVLTTYGMPDIDRREADVAIRISNDPPEDLIGRRVLSVAGAIYVGTEHFDAFESESNRAANDGRLGRIGWSARPTEPRSARSARSARIGKLEDLPITAIVTDPFATVRALQCGMGISTLPCYIGDSEATLRRVPPGDIHRRADMWVLAHRDLRKTARVRQFTDFIVGALIRHQNLLEGKSELT